MTSPELRVLITGLSIAPVERWVSNLLDGGAEIIHLGFVPTKHHGRPAERHSNYRFVPYAGLAQFDREALMTQPESAAQALPTECAHLKQLAAEFQPHIYHSMGLDYGAQACAATGLHPYAITGMGYLNDLIFKETARLPDGVMKILTCADALLVQAPILVPRCRALLPSSVWIDFLQNGLDTQIFKPTTHAAQLQTRRALHLPADGTVVLSMRGWDPIYNHHLVLEAFVRALPQLPAPACLLFLEMNRSHLLARAVDYVNQVRAQATALGVQEHVRFLPAIPQVMMPAIINAADMIVSYPKHDTLPISIVEALACERPVIAGHLPAFEGTFCDEFCILVESQNPEALANAMVQVAHHPPPAELRSAARRAVIAEHDSRVVTRRMMDLYAKMRNLDTSGSAR